MHVFAIFLSTLSSSLTSYFYVLLYLFLAISFVLALKLFVYYSLIAANIIIVYIFGFVVISVNLFTSLVSYGLLSLSFYLYLFLSVYYAFLLVLFLIELFSSFFNSLTLTNRLSINIFVGSLLINLLSLLSSLFGVLVLAVFFIYESLNLLFQSFIFLLLSFFYLSSYHTILPICRIRYSLPFPPCFSATTQSTMLSLCPSNRLRGDFLAFARFMRYMNYHSTSNRLRYNHSFPISTQSTFPPSRYAFSLISSRYACCFRLLCLWPITP